MKSIELNYKKTEFFDRYMPVISQILLSRHDNLVDLNYDLLIFGLESLGIKIKITKASDIFGEQGQNYADIEKFNHNGVLPYFQSYNHPTYTQKNKNFEPFMSFIDLLFNHGDDSLEIIMSRNISTEEIINIIENE